MDSETHGPGTVCVRVVFAVVRTAASYASIAAGSSRLGTRKGEGTGGTEKGYGAIC